MINCLEITKIALINLLIISFLRFLTGLNSKNWAKIGFIKYLGWINKINNN
jgi:hypothetical protein